MNQNRYRATVMLAASALIFGISIPWSATFWGGFVFSASTAALVGGIADWFAVTALFRRPLGIPFRTEIIPRGRERIFNDMVHIVENRLLTKDRVKEEIARHNLADVVIDYLERHQGRAKLEMLVSQVVEELLRKIKPREAGRTIEILLKTQLREMAVAPLAAKIIFWLVKHGYEQRMVAFFLAEAARLCATDYVRDKLTEVIEKTKEVYSDGRSGRKLLLWFFDSGSLSSSLLSAKLQQGLLDILATMQQPDSEFNRFCHDELVKLAATLPENRQLTEKLAKLKNDWVDQLEFRDFAGGWLEQQIEIWTTGEATRPWVRPLQEYSEMLFQNFSTNKTQQELVDQLLKEMLNQAIEEHHQQLGMLVKENLDKYTNQRLVNLIESKVGDDLQMIRINGSLVGAAVGLFLHIADLCLSR